MEKADGAFLTIGELAQQLGVAQHILRYWESRFPQLRPLQRAGNRRYYRPQDVAVAQSIHHLLNVQGFTIKGAAKALADKGVQTDPLLPEVSPAPATQAPVTPASAAVVPAQGASAEQISADAMLADFLIDRLQLIRGVLSDALALGEDGPGRS